MSGDFQGEDSWGFGDDIPSGDQETRSSLPRRPTSFAPGQQFGPFLLLALLGEGGFGSVFKARAVGSEREVAVKILGRGQQLEERQLRRFEREGELTAALSHPGIVRIHSAGEVEGVPYLAYELVEGGKTFEEAQAELGRAERAALLRDVARALGYAHDHGVVHRDLKPENILIDVDGQARVADFGLAWSEGVDRLTRSGAMVGTPSHMAPEQWSADHAAISPATDVWALGAMLYRALTDAPPFHGANMVEMAAQVCSATPRRPRAVDATVPPPLEAVCLKALEKDPERRYPDANAFANDLENALANRPVSASSTGWSSALALQLRRSRPYVIPLAILVSLVLGGLVLYLSAQRGEREERLRRLLAVYRAGKVGPQELRAALEDTAGLSPALRCDLHLALARSAAGDHDRLRHAGEAVRLATTDQRAGALLVRGRLRRAAGQFAEAAEDFGAARAAGAKPEATLEQAEALLGAGLAKEAEARARAFLEQPTLKSTVEARALGVLLRSQVATKQVARASATLARYLDVDRGPDAAVLRAELQAAKGEDPEPALRAAIKKWADHAGLRLALARYLFVVRGEARAARSELRAAAAQLGELAPLQEALAGLLAAPLQPEAMRKTPREWRAAGARWVVREVERELAFAVRSNDPRTVEPKDARSPAERRTRAGQLLEAGLRFAPPGAAAGRVHLAFVRLRGAEDAAKHLARAESLLPGIDGDLLRVRAAALLEAGRPAEALRDLQVLGTRGKGAAVAHLRGRALLALKRYRDAVPQLERALGPERLRVAACIDLVAALRGAGRSKEAGELARHVKTLRGAHRSQGLAMETKARQLRKSDAPGEEILAAYRRAYELDPASPDVRISWGRAVFSGTGGNRLEGLRIMIGGAMDDPRLLGEAKVNLLGVSRGLLKGRTLIQQMAEKLSYDGSARDHLIRGMLRTMAAEFERRSDWLPLALQDLSSTLRQDPANVVAWTLRGFVHLRLGRLARAERDLQVAVDAAPDAADAVFYQALLFAAQRRPIHQVRERVKAAFELHFLPWLERTWDPKPYVEMAPFRDKKGFERFKG